MRRSGGTPWKPGQSGNPMGRPPGSRNKLSTMFMDDLKDVWEREGINVLERLARDDPAALARTVASLMPKDVHLNIDVQSFVVRAPSVAVDSTAWQATVLAPVASSAEIIELVANEEPEAFASPVLPEPIGD